MIRPNQIGALVRTLATLTLLVAFFSLLPQVNVTAQGLFGDFEADAREQLADLSAAFSMSSVPPGQTDRAVARVNIVSGWHINSANPYQDYLIPAQIELDSLDGITPHSIVYPSGSDMTLLGDKMSVYDGRVLLYFEVSTADDVAHGEYAIPIRLTYQACNDRECRPPQTIETRLLVTVGAAGQAANAELFGETSPTTASTGVDAATDGQQSQLERLIVDYGFWGYFLALGLAFVTGLLLSFSPCTYPMIPITVSIFAGQERSVGKGFVMSLFYVGSMAVMYGIMGLIVSLVGGVFGAWLASPAVVIGIAVVFVVFALSMFGLYNLDLPLSVRQKLGTAKSGGGIFGVIILGIIAALVVSPCVGPFVAGILLYVATYGSPIFGFLILFTFAIGLGALYIIIGTFSSAINSLPGAGGWMETVKKFFGFVLLLMALYFLRTILPPTTLAVLSGLLLLAFGVFGGGLDRLTGESGFFDRLKKMLGIIALLLGVYLLMGTVVRQGLILPGVADLFTTTPGISTEKDRDLIPWGSDLTEGLKRASEEGKPVLIDTWATWCVNCKVLDEKTFRQPEVAREAERFVPIKVQLETTGSEITRDFMQRFGIKQYSLPTVLLLDADGKVRKVLQGVVGPEDMISEMEKVR